MQIAVVVTRHGAADALATVTGWARRMAGRGGGVAPVARRSVEVRRALEELGVTFVKLGQVLSTRADLVPPELARELGRLQDDAPPEPPGVVAAVIERELGRPPEEVFASFGPEPIAAASIGQAHGAVLHDGRAVVVKVRRPWAVQQVDVDLAILARLARAAARISRLARRYDVEGLVGVFSSTLRQELDYRAEAAHAARFARMFEGDADVHIPAVVPEASTGAVLTLELVTGTKINDVAALDAAGIDRPAVARRAANTVLRMVFDHGFFHADLHPGNVFVQPDGSLALIDFGMVGTIDPALGATLVQALTAMVARDGTRLVDAVVALGVAGGDTDRRALEADLLVFAERELDRPLGEVSVASLLAAVLSIARRHRLVLPLDLALLARAMAVCEGVGAQLDPSFRLVTALVPYLAGYTRGQEGAER